MGSKRNRKKNKTQNKGVQVTNSQLMENAKNQAEEEMIGNSIPPLMENDLRDALGISSSGVQLSQADTLFKNNRWYLVSNLRQLLSQLYVEIGILKTVVDIPVEDGLRGGINISTKQLDEEQIQLLETRMEQQDDLETFSQASKWNRLFGGAAVLIMTDQPPNKPLNWDTIDKDTPLEFRDLDMWELYYSKQNTKDYAAAIDNRELDVEYYDYYGVQVHKSRVLLMKGIKAPSFVRPRLRGWGVSIVETLVRSINQYLKSTDLSFEVLDEFKIDIFRIKGLSMALHTKDGTEKIRNRTALVNEEKNYKHAITMDAEDDYQQKQLSFAGLSEVMSGIRMQIASDVRMPLTKLFGISAAGFSSGEDDIENYNATIESGVRSKGKPVILTMLKLRCQQLFGFVPDDLSFEYQPLRVLSSADQENVKNSQFNRTLQARQAGEISRLEFREACNKNELLPLQLENDNVDDELGQPTADIVKEPVSNSVNDVNRNIKMDRVSVVCVMSGNEVLRGKRRDNGRWTCPAGHLEGDEDAKDGAIREVFEESGIRLLRSDLKEMGERVMISRKTGKETMLYAYEAQIPKVEATSENDPDKEVEKWEWIDTSKDHEALSYEHAHTGLGDVMISHIKSK